MVSSQHQHDARKKEGAEATEQGRFGTLSCAVYDAMSDSWREIGPNSERAFPVVSEYFEGEGMVLIKTPEFEDRYQSTVFDESQGRTRLFEVQIRGRFTKRAPGVLYIAGELEAPRMQISALTRLAARASLAFLRAMGGEGLHYSFGDSTQKPHIATPLWSSLPTAHRGVEADFRVGDVCDVLESADQKKKRRGAGPTGARAMMTGDDRYWTGASDNTDKDQYFTCSFNAANADLRTWTARFPGLPTLDLHRLWHDSALIVSLYALQGSDTYDHTVPHTFATKRYMAAIRLHHRKDGFRPRSRPNDDRRDREKRGDTDVSDADTAAPVSNPASNPERTELLGEDAAAAAVTPNPLAAASDDEAAVVSDDELFQDALGWPAWNERFAARVEGDDESSGDESFATARQPDDDDDQMYAEPTSPRAQPSLKAAVFNRVSLASVSLRRWLGGPPKCEALVLSKAGADLTDAPARCVGRLVAAVDALRRREYYLISLGHSTGEKTLRLVRRKTARSPPTCSYSAACALVPPYSRGASRVSRVEKRRRRVDATAAAVGLASQALLADWLGAGLDDEAGTTRRQEKTRTDSDSAQPFLFPPGVLAEDKWRTKMALPANQGAGHVRSGPCLRASSRTTWHEEWLSLGEKSGLTFYSGLARAAFHLDPADVLDAYPVVLTPPERGGGGKGKPRETCRPSPFVEPAAFSFELATAERVVRVAVKTADERDAWVRAVLVARRTLSGTSGGPWFEVDDEPSRQGRGSAKLVRDRLATPGDDYFPRGRYVLNARSPFDDLPASDKNSTAPCVQPLNNVEAVAVDLATRAGKLVDKARALARQPGDDDDDETAPLAWRDFVEATGVLRDLEPEDLVGVTVAFWLNLYHAMLCHAALLFGPPSRAAQWARHFSSLSYECAGDVFSLAELEHCVVRAGRPRPRLLLSDAKSFGTTSVAVDLLRVATATSAVLASPYAYALDVDDVRVALALNPGSLSDAPDLVPVYDPDPTTLDAQLDAAAGAALAFSRFDPDARVLALPRKCAWLSMGLTHLQPNLPPGAKAAVAAFLSGPVPDASQSPGGSTRRRPRALSEDGSGSGLPSPSAGRGRAFLKLAYLPFNYSSAAPRIIPDYHQALSALAACSGRRPRDTATLPPSPRQPNASPPGGSGTTPSARSSLRRTSPPPPPSSRAAGASLARPASASALARLALAPSSSSPS